MRRRIESRLRKAIRQKDHYVPGLQAAIEESGRGLSLSDALFQIAVGTNHQIEHRRFCVHLLWKTSGAKRFRSLMIQSALESKETKYKAQYFQLWPSSPW